MTLGELLIKLKVDGTKEAESEVKGFGNSLKSLNILTAASAAAVGTVLVKAFNACIDAAADAELVTAKLNAVIKSTGGIAGITSKAALDLSSSLQQVTTYDDEAITSGQTLLLTFTKIGKDVFPQATEAILDMSTVLGQDLRSSAIQVGKALNDPIQGVIALRRVGVQLSSAQENQIKQFMLTNNIAAAQGVILKELSTQMGGAARAAAETYSGRLAQLKNAFGDLKETIGNMFIGSAGESMVGLKVAVEEITAAVKFLQITYLKAAATMADVNKALAIGERENYLALKRQVEVYTELRRAQGLFKEESPTGGKPATGGGGGENAIRQKALDDLLKIQQDYENKRIQLSRDGLAQINADETKAMSDLQATGLAGSQKYEETKFSITKYYADLRKEYERQTALQIATTATTALQTMTSGLSGIFSQYITNKSIELDNDQYTQQQRIDSEYEREKAKIGANVSDEKERAAQLKALDEKKAREEQALQKKVDKERRKMQREAAIYQKGIAITDAIINTARGVTSALGMFPPPVAWAMAAISAALGAAQVALIARQPLPAAAQGGVFNTPYIGGEAGAEMAVPLTGGQGQNAIRALASGMLDVMSQATDNRATISDSSPASGGMGGPVLLDGILVGKWLSRAGENGLYSVPEKIIIA